MELYDLIKGAFLVLDDADRHFLSQYDLSVARYYALRHIGAKPGISFSELSDRLLCDKSNVSRIVKGLEADDYVKRKPHETDGRSLRLYLTAAGRNLHTEVAAAHRNYIENQFNAVGEAERKELVQSLAQFNHKMTSSHQD